ncbi:hypothetical protein FRC10_010309 [Ceratobasidium sp. 414]|nr:hypothetical protein FRC10_010309 [Ceratobasidium sp. 414]
MMQARAQAAGQARLGIAPADDDDEVPDLIENFDAVALGSKKEEEEAEDPETKTWVLCAKADEPFVKTIHSIRHKRKVYTTQWSSGGPLLRFTFTTTPALTMPKHSETKETAGDAKEVPLGATTVVIRHPKFCFDNTLIALQIENTLFNVHKYQLTKSTTFSDMFAIAEESEDEQTTREGSSLDNPIVMQGVSASDFECLMTVLYTSHFSAHQNEPEASLIIPAFRLANMWNFAELCAYLGPLAERVLGDADRIVFAREFKVAEWLAPAHARLCLREEKIMAQEAEKIGLSREPEKGKRNRTLSQLQLHDLSKLWVYSHNSGRSIAYGGYGQKKYSGMVGRWMYVVTLHDVLYVDVNSNAATPVQNENTLDLQHGL